METELLEKELDMEMNRINIFFLTDIWYSFLQSSVVGVSFKSHALYPIQVHAYILAKNISGD